MSSSLPLKRDALPFLPYGRQTIDEGDIDAVCQVLRGDYLTTGPLIERFETALAEAVCARDAVVCSSGTAALYMTARALQLGPGTKAIVPSLTFLATASAPHLAGAEIVFADVDPDCGLMRPGDLAHAFDRARGAEALFNVHLNGQCGEVEEISAIARFNEAAVIDDGCHALGTTVAGMRVGENAFSDMTVFSFHPVKTVTMGEGGAVTTNSEELARALRRERNHGMTRAPGEFLNPDAFDASGKANRWYYELIGPGFNWRATDIHCALGLSQLGKLDRFSAQRRALAAAYDALLAPYAPVIRPVAQQRGCTPTLHLYPVLIDFEGRGLPRGEVMARLAEDGIGTQVHYYPVHRQRYFVERYGRLELPGADRYYARVLSLPFFAGMTISDVERVVDALARTLAL